VSTRDLAQIAAAEIAGADYVGFGPCFPTATKGYREGLAPAAVRAAVAAARLPLFAIGGITADHLPDLVALGCSRVAVSAAILDAPDPEGVARALRRHLG
jgi:thiamine-phosphate pyrophosphorylase